MEREWDKGKGNGHRFHQFKFFGGKTICTFCNGRFGLLACWTEPNGQLGWSGYLNVTSGFISPCAQLSADETSWVSCFWSSKPVVASEQEGKVELEEFCGKFFVPFDFSSPVATFTNSRSWLDIEEVLWAHSIPEPLSLYLYMYLCLYFWFVFVIEHASSVVVFVYVFVFVFVFLICVCNTAGGSGYAS